MPVSLSSCSCNRFEVFLVAKCSLARWWAKVQGANLLHYVATDTGQDPGNVGLYYFACVGVLYARERVMSFILLKQGARPSMGGALGCKFLRFKGWVKLKRLLDQDRQVRQYDNAVAELVPCCDTS